MQKSEGCTVIGNVDREVSGNVRVLDSVSVHNLNLTIWGKLGLGVLIFILGERCGLNNNLKM